MSEPVIFEQQYGLARPGYLTGGYVLLAEAIPRSQVSDFYNTRNFDFSVVRAQQHKPFCKQDKDLSIQKAHFLSVDHRILLSELNLETLAREDFEDLNKETRKDIVQKLTLQHPRSSAERAIKKFFEEAFPDSLFAVRVQDATKQEYGTLTPFMSDN